jgi:GTP-binding protein
MKVTAAQLEISAVSARQYPQDVLPEISLAGRSNVGKSSFINRLIHRKALARTSSKPGKTQTLNFYRINEQFYFVDVPGYGYAKVSKKERQRWGRFIEQYLTTRSKLQAVCLLIDLRHPPTKDDQLMYGFLEHLQLPTLIIGTKADKLPKGKIDRHVQVIRRTLQVDQDKLVIPFSSATGLGKEQVWHHLLPYLKRQHTT